MTQLPRTTECYFERLGNILGFFAHASAVQLLTQIFVICDAVIIRPRHPLVLRHLVQSLHNSDEDSLQQMLFVNSTLVSVTLLSQT